MAKYDYRGAIHCHSTYSDGTGSYDDIGKAANDAGLDFVIMTDHDISTPLKDGHEGWKESCLFIVGAEVKPTKNHYLVMGDEPLQGLETLKDKSPQEVIDEVKRQGWLGFISHPDHPGSEQFQIPMAKWEKWDVTGFTGMSIWDLMTDWLAQVERGDLAPDQYEKFSELLTGPRPETLERWDHLNKQGKVVGIGEIDNHCYERKHDGEKYSIFPYEVAFGTVTNHVLLDDPLAKDPKKAKAQILTAIKNGNLYISFDQVEDPTEFNFEIDDGENSVSIGGEFPLVELAEVIVSLPEEGVINVLRNGQSICEEQGNEVVVEIREPGVYRIEVIKNDMLWILSNPIYVTGKATPEPEAAEEPEA